MTKAELIERMATASWDCFRSELKTNAAMKLSAFDKLLDRERSTYKRQICAALKAIDEAGFTIVPKEPTDKRKNNEPINND